MLKKLFSCTVKGSLSSLMPYCSLEKFKDKNINLDEADINDTLYFNYFQPRNNNNTDFIATNTHFILSGHSHKNSHHYSPPTNWRHPDRAGELIIDLLAWLSTESLLWRKINNKRGSTDSGVWNSSLET